MSKLKNRLKELRRTKLVSVNEMAAFLGKSESTVRTWETGKSFPDAITLLNLANQYGVSVDWLLGRADTVIKRDMSVPSKKIALLILKSYTSTSNMDTLLSIIQEYGSVAETLIGKEAVKIADSLMVDRKRLKHRESMLIKAIASSVAD